MNWHECKTPPPEWVAVLVWHRSRPWGAMTVDTGRYVNGRWQFAANVPCAMGLENGPPFMIYQPRRWAYMADACAEAEGGKIYPDPALPAFSAGYQASPESAEGSKPRPEPMQETSHGNGGETPVYE